MKILALENTFAEIDNFATKSFACYPDNSVLRNNDNFYFPNFSKSISAHIGIYVTISKIGKHIEPQFIPRYYKEFGVAVNFIASDCVSDCIQKGISSDFARGFDHSFAMSTLQLKTLETTLHEAKFSLNYNNQTYSFVGSEIQNQLHTLLSEISCFYTIKIGDIFFVPFISIPNSIAISDEFECSIQDNHFLSCKVL